MSKLIALLQFLLALAGIHTGGTNYSTRVAANGHDALSSQAHVQGGVARFECEASDSGWCHYTLYPDACANKACSNAPLRQFSVASGQSRQFAGLSGFRLCVESDSAAVGPDCKPRATVAKH